MRPALLLFVLSGCPSRTPMAGEPGSPGTDRLVAVGEAGRIVVSDDGVAWTPREVPPLARHDLRAVTWGDGTFVAVGEAGTIVWSRGGDEWQRVQSLAPYQLNDVAWDGTQFVAVGGDWDSGAVTLVSPDGALWAGWESPASHVLEHVISGDAGALATGFYRSDLMFLGVFVAGDRRWEPSFAGDAPG